MKKVMWVITFLIVVSCLLFLSIPMIASTNLGKKIIINAISQKMGGKLEVSSWSLSWFGPQVVRNAEFKSKNLEFYITQFNCDMPFWSFFSFSRFEKTILHSLNGKAEIANATIILHSPNDASAYFENLDASLIGSNGKDINFTLIGNTRVEKIEGAINIEAKIDSVDNIFTDLPTLIKVDLSNFPSMGLDRWIHSLKLKKTNPILLTLNKERDFFSKFLGNRLNLDLIFSSNGQMGNLNAFLDATNGQTTINASIEDKYLYLNESLFASFQLTPSLSKYLIKDVNPLFITGVEALNPVTLAINAQGFALPLDSFSIKNLLIQKATLDMGKIKCKNGGTLSIIIGLMKLHSLQKVDEMTIWFTPVNIQIEDGIAYTDRMDALVADDIHICTWGNVNLVNKKLDMILGLTAQALNNAFKLKGLPSDYVMTIPLTGTTDDPTLDASKVAAKIATLMAAQAASNKVFGLSGLLQALGTSDQEKVPPPKTPFPWGSTLEIPSNNSTDPLEKKSPFFDW